MTTRKVILVGNHPIKEYIIRQYQERRYEVVSDVDAIEDCDELFLLSDINNPNSTEADYATIAELDTLSNMIEVKDQQIKCHLLLRNMRLLHSLYTTEFCKSIRRKLDVNPFSVEEIWSRSIQLDYEPITIHSDKHVHLVIFGVGEVAETVAIQAAHVAHYPNYVRNHSFRTRITMIASQAEMQSEGFIKRYQHLFDNSYYRIVNPVEEKVVRVFHKPMYDGRREDFVDVEWEFVDAEGWNPDVREKLRLWAQDDKQLLTVVMADKDADKNVAMSLFLPDELYQRSIPIHKYNPNAVEYDVTMPLVQMAKNVNYIYDRCYNDNIENWQGQVLSSVEINPADRDSLWDNLSSVKRWSSIYNAMTIPSKMRSIGLDEEDWDKFYDISQQDIEILAQVEHNRWSVEELILGFRPCTDEEQDKIAADVKTQKDAYKARKVHYDLRAYDDLRPDGTGKPVQVYDLCLSAALPLIAKTFVDEKGGEA